jgi:hypothetical protein
MCMHSGMDKLASLSKSCAYASSSYFLVLLLVTVYNTSTYFIKSCVLISEYADHPWIGQFPGLVPAMSQGTYVREV